jgi:hypothetical protein
MLVIRPARPAMPWFGSVRPKDRINAVIDGGMILARGFGDPRVLVRQIPLAPRPFRGNNPLPQVKPACRCTRALPDMRA